MLIDLVYPGSTTGSENYSSEPPLGPLAIFSSLPEAWRARARFLDSTLMPDGDIASAVRSRRADVVAMSCTTFNYSRALHLAAVAKEHGACVILGGIHITHLVDRILARMQRGEIPVDYVVTGYGEPAFLPLLDALSREVTPRDIPNLCFVHDGRIVRGGASYWRGGADPLVARMDYSLIDFRRYSARFQRTGNLADVQIAASIYTQRGCAYAGKRKCTFCSIEQVNPRRSPSLVQQDVTSLITDHHADHIRIDDGDFTVSTRHMARVADAVEAAVASTGKRPTFYCFTRADEIDDERIELFRRLNIVSVFIGYESGSDRMLSSMQKHTTREQNLAATRILKEAGIDVVCAGIVLGAEGETEETLGETMSFVEQLAQVGNVRSLVATPLIPLPGSPSFSRLHQALAKSDPDTYSRIVNADDFDIEELIHLWNASCCKTTVARQLEIADAIATMFPIGIRFLEFSRGEMRSTTIADKADAHTNGQRGRSTSIDSLPLPVLGSHGPQAP